MGIQIVIPVDKSRISALKGDLYKLIISAQDVSGHSTFEQLRKAKESLDIAKGLHMALSSLELIDDFAATADDLDRIERKHMGILEDKRRRDYPRWKH